MSSASIPLIRPLPRFFWLPNFVLLRAFMAGWKPLYLLEARAEIQKYFGSFLVQMKKLEFAFEIN